MFVSCDSQVFPLLRVQNRSELRNRPSHFFIDEVCSAKTLGRSAVLRLPILSSIICIQDLAAIANRVSNFIVDKVEVVE